MKTIREMKKYRIVFYRIVPTESLQGTETGYIEIFAVCLNSAKNIAEALINPHVLFRVEEA